MQKDQRKKRIALVMLVTFILFIVSLSSWWLLGKKESSENIITTNGQAFNTKLPDANLKESGKNKLEIYMQAEKDSAKLKEQEKKDALVKHLYNPGPPDDDVFSEEYPPKKKKEPSYHRRSSVEQNEKKVNNRLEKLYAALNDKSETNADNPFPGRQDKYSSVYDDNVAQLEKLLQQVQHTDADSNPEMKQVESMLDKVLDIQHPERVKERLSKNTTKLKENVLLVAISNTDSVVSGETIAFWG